MRAKPPEHRAALCDAIYDTFSDLVGVAADDRDEVITEHEPNDLNIVANFVGVQRSSDAMPGTLELVHSERESFICGYRWQRTAGWRLVAERGV